MPSEEDRKKIEEISKEEILRILKEERPHEVILQELKDAYQRQWDLKDSHERKAISIITIAGILITLLFGFAGFIIRINSASPITHYNLVILFIIISIGANSLTVLLSIISLKMKDYIFLYTDTFKENKTKEAVLKHSMKPKQELLSDLLIEYSDAINHNAQQNQSKLRWLKVAYWSLFSGIISILIVIIITQIK